MFLCFALSLSLACVSATFVVDILATVILSTTIVRLLESLLVMSRGKNLTLVFCMEVAMLPLLLPSILLETISLGFRSFSLGFRIFANVSAGHVLSDIVLVLRYVPSSSTVTALTHFLFSYGILVYESLVAAIQLGVFLSLTSVYAD